MAQAGTNPETEEKKLPWPIEMLPVHGLRPAKRNARTHSKKQIREVANSIQRFGVMVPVIADGHRYIVAGHARGAAAKLLGLQYLPVIQVSHLSEAEIRACALADNKLATKAGWDREILAIELQELQIALPEINLDISATGFDPGEINSIMLDFADDEARRSDEIPEIEGLATAQIGDLFELGRHRLVVGDARDPDAFASLMQGDLAEMAFLDPPFNVRVHGHTGGRGRIKHREFECASGEMTKGEFVSFLKTTLLLCAENSRDGAIHFICMDWRHVGELLEAGHPIYHELKNICAWVKTNAGQGSFYRNAHELVFVYKRGTAPHINTFELGQHGRSRSNVWQYAGVNSFRAGRMDELKMHPTVKPVALVADAMRDCSRRNSIVLDAFAGSGTTIMAAEQVGRRAFCMEIDPKYVDVAIRRWQRITGGDAIHKSTKQTFEELTAIRRDSETGRRNG